MALLRTLSHTVCFTLKCASVFFARKDENFNTCPDFDFKWSSTWAAIDFALIGVPKYTYRSVWDIVIVSIMIGRVSSSLMTRNWDLDGWMTIPRSSVHCLSRVNFWTKRSRDVANTTVSSISRSECRVSSQPSGPSAATASTVGSMKNVNRGQLLLAPWRTPAEVENFPLPMRPDACENEAAMAFMKVVPQLYNTLVQSYFWLLMNQTRVLKQFPNSYVTQVPHWWSKLTFSGHIWY